MKYALIKSDNGTLNALHVSWYYTYEAAWQRAYSDFIVEYMEFYDTEEPPREEDNGYGYWADPKLGRIVLSLDVPDTPEWAVKEVDE